MRRESDPIQPPFFCPICWKPVGFSDENDYICDDHSFVNGVTADGRLLNGDGWPGPRRVIGRAKTVIHLPSL